MDIGITVKEEIEIDDYEFGQIGLPIKEEMALEEFDKIESMPCLPDENNELKIIEERPDMITISVGELKSEDERNFIASLDSEMFFANGRDSSSKLENLNATSSDTAGTNEFAFKRIKLSKQIKENPQIQSEIDIKQEFIEDDKSLLCSALRHFEDPSVSVVRMKQLNNNDINTVGDLIAQKAENTAATTLIPDVSKLRLPSIKKTKETSISNLLEKRPIRVNNYKQTGVISLKKEFSNFQSQPQLSTVPFSSCPSSSDTPCHKINSSLVIKKITSEQKHINFNENKSERKTSETSLLRGCRIIHLSPNAQNSNNLAPNIKLFHLPPNTKIVPLKALKVVPMPNVSNTTTMQTDTVPTQHNINISESNLLANATQQYTSPIQSKYSNITPTLMASPSSEPVPNPIYTEPSIIPIAKHNRSFCFANGTMNYIENLPSPRKVIENIKNQIRVIEETSAIPPELSVLSNKTLDMTEMELEGTLEKAVKSANEIQPEIPSSLFLQVSGTDKELLTARKAYPDYRFAWMCPHCARQYELKYSFRSHLFNVHDVTTNVYEKLVVEVRPFKLLTPLEAEKAIKSPDPDNSKPYSAKPSTNTNLSDNSGNNSVDHNLKNDNIACQKCGMEFRSKDLLTDHTKNNCGRSIRQKCPDCSKYFYSMSTLNCHRSIHTGELPYKCNYCDKRFRTRGQVTVHHRTHTGERPFTCQVCQLSFTHRETLISHLSRHIGMKRYKCYGCNKNFSCISGLRTHRDVRPDTCGRVKFSPRAIGPRVRVVRGKVIFEQPPTENTCLRSEDPNVILSDIQNQQKT